MFWTETSARWIYSYSYLKSRVAQVLEVEVLKPAQSFISFLSENSEGRTRHDSLEGEYIRLETVGSWSQKIPPFRRFQGKELIGA